MAMFGGEIFAYSRTVNDAGEKAFLNMANEAQVRGSYYSEQGVCSYKTLFVEERSHSHH